MGGSSSCSCTNQSDTINEIKDTLYNQADTIDNIRNYLNNQCQIFHSANDNISKNNELYNKKKSENNKKLNEINVQFSSFTNINTSLKNDIELLYRNIDSNIQKNEEYINNINNLKKDITSNSYSIPYLQDLLLQTYSSFYDAINIENKSLDSNKDLRKENYSIDKSLYFYKEDKIIFYKNINTFLFYLYFVLIIILLVIVFKYRNQLELLKMKYFRVFLVILIVYPFFILRFQNLFFNLFNNYIYLNISDDYDNNEYRNIVGTSSSNNLIDSLNDKKTMFINFYKYLKNYFDKYMNYYLHSV
jgi:hypothetical protein